MEPQGVAPFVEPDGMADLRRDHRDHVAPRAEHAGLGRETSFAREFRDEVGRNQFDELAQYGGVPPARLS